MSRGISKSVRRIMKYVERYPLKCANKKFLFAYANMLEKAGYENKKTPSKDEILADANNALEQLRRVEQTDIVKKRIKVLERLINNLNKNDKLPIEFLSKASICLDKMYIDMELPVRKSSSLSYDLEEFVTIGETYEK